MHLAAAGGHTEIIQLLLDQTVPVLDEDKDGMTALHLAAMHGRRNSIESLKGKIPFNIVSVKVRYKSKFDMPKILFN